MRERILTIEQDRVPVAELEALLQARIGWVHRVVSPFALASRREWHNRDRVVPLHRFLSPSLSQEKLRLVG